MMIKEDIWYFNYTALEMIIVTFFKYLLSCNGGNVRFEMYVPAVQWFTDGTTDLPLDTLSSSPIAVRRLFSVDLSLFV